MASTTPKQLGDLLQEQQEPFSLKSYLLERGYSKNKLNSEHGWSCCCSSNSDKFLKSSSSCGVSKRRKVIPNCSKIVKAAFNKLVSIKMRMKNLETSDQTINACIHETAKEERFSSASSTTVFNSCSNSDIEDTNASMRKCGSCQASEHGNLLNEGEVTTDRNGQRRCLDERKQLSPVSVLEDTLSDENSPINDTQHNVKTRIEETSTMSNISAKLVDQSWKEKPRHTNGCEVQDLVTSDPPSQYMKIKMALQQTKQLLFDCVSEAVETHGWKNTTPRRFHELLGPEEIGNLLCKNIWIWSKQSMDVSNTTQLLDFNLSASAEEWSDFKHQKKEVCLEIGDAILEDLTKEIVIDMITIVPKDLCKASREV